MLRRLLPFLFSRKPAMTPSLPDLRANLNALSHRDYHALVSLTLKDRLSSAVAETLPEAPSAGAEAEQTPGVVDPTDTMDELYEGEAPTGAPPKAAPAPNPDAGKHALGKVGERVRIRSDADIRAHYAAPMVARIRHLVGTVVGELDSAGDVRVRYTAADVVVPASWLVLAA